jgi:hypothetical protein
MKAKWVTYTLIVVMFLVPGCQCWNQFVKGCESQTAGLNRIVDVYSYDGKHLGHWRSKTVIDADSGGLTTFFDSTGQRVLVNGGILISTEYK